MHPTRRAPSAHDSRRRCRLDAWNSVRCGAGGGLIIGCLVAALGCVIAPTPLTAQAREVERYGAGAPEGKLMLYYSSTVAFSPLGVPYGVERAWGTASSRTLPRLEAAVEVSYLPELSLEQRTTGSDKPEATNLAPVFPRPRVAVGLPAGIGLELSWIPPVRVFDVKANLFGAAVSGSFSVTSAVRAIPRASVLVGRVEGPITCNRETAEEGDAALATYFSLVCYGNDSRDYFEPHHIAGELILAPANTGGRWQPYLSAGARSERTRFDVGVIRRDGVRDNDQPILEVQTTRAFATVGASWFGLSRTRLTGELYYAPGSVLTGRVLAGVRLW